MGGALPVPVGVDQSVDPLPLGGEAVVPGGRLFGEGAEIRVGFDLSSLWSRCIFL